MDLSEGKVFEMVHQVFETAGTRPFRQANNNSNETRRRRRDDPLALSPAGLIKTLPEAVQAEMVELHFDYMLLNTKCWTILSGFK